jgi:hypothetical protein
VTALRTGLGEPLIQLPPETVDEIRTFLDGQSRVKAAAWARHEEPGNGPETIDHHILLAVTDEDWATGDLWALERGIELPSISMVGSTWRDFFPLSELPEIRPFATILWEQTIPGDDPLDYRFTYEPFVTEPAQLERFTELVRSQPAVHSVGALVAKLWKGDELLEQTASMAVEASPPANVLPVVMNAARTTIFAGWSSTNGSLGRSQSDAMTTLYEAAA